MSYSRLSWIRRGARRHLEVDHPVNRAGALGIRVAGNRRCEGSRTQCRWATMSTKHDTLESVVYIRILRGLAIGPTNPRRLRWPKNASSATTCFRISRTRRPIRSTTDWRARTAARSSSTAFPTGTRPHHRDPGSRHHRRFPDRRHFRNTVVDFRRPVLAR